MWLFHNEIFVRWTTTQAIMHHSYLLRKRHSLFGLADISGTKKRKWWRWDCGPKVRQGEGRGWVDWKHWSLSLTSRQSHTTKACVVELSVSPIGGAFFSIVHFFCVCIRPYIKPKICRRLWYVAVVKSHTADMWQHATVYIWVSVDIFLCIRCKFWERWEKVLMFDRCSDAALKHLSQGSSKRCETLHSKWRRYS